MIKLTYADYVAQAGLVEADMMTPPNYGWMQKAYISMGNQLHGNNLNSDWIALYSGVPNYAELASIPWTDLVGWIYVHPGAANTCTNSAIQIYDFQIQIFNLLTNQWELASDPAVGRNLLVSTWYDLDTPSISGGATDKIYPNRYNMPALSSVKVSGDRAAASSDPSKYWALHNAMSRVVNVDYTKIGGIVALCRAKLVSVDGLAFNGVSQIMMAVGVDAYPTPNSSPGKGAYTTISGNIGAGDTTIPVASGTSLPAYGTVKIDSETIRFASVSGNNMLGCTRAVNGTTAASHTSGATVSGLLTGVDIMPSMTINAFQIVTAAEKAYMATTAKLSNNAIIQTTSAYQQSFPAGTYPQCMSAGLFAANVPQFMAF